MSSMPPRIISPISKPFFPCPPASYQGLALGHQNSYRIALVFSCLASRGLRSSLILYLESTPFFRLSQRWYYLYLSRKSLTQSTGDWVRYPAFRDIRVPHAVRMRSASIVRYCTPCLMIRLCVYVRVYCTVIQCPRHASVRSG